METREQLRRIVEYAYAALDQNVAEQTIEMSMDFIGKAASGMTMEQIQDVISSALDTTENRRLNPKWFGDVIRNTKSGTNLSQDEVETSRPAPQSSGNFDLDTKCDFMAMWAQVYYTSQFGEQHAIICNWDTQYRFLLKHGIMDEPQGWLEEWKGRAKERIRAKMLANGTLREVIDSRRAIKAALDNNTEIMNTVYQMRVKDLIYKSQQLTADAFSQRFNSATPELPAVFVIQDDSKEHFHIEIRQ